MVENFPGSDRGFGEEFDDEGYSDDSYGRGGPPRPGEGFDRERDQFDDRPPPPPRGRRPPPSENRGRAARPPLESNDQQSVIAGQEGGAVENPYGGTRFLTRDTLVEDNRLVDPQAALPEGGAVSPDPITSALRIVPVDYDFAEFPYAKDESWTEVDEPFGDESSMQARLVPDPPIAGQPVKLQVTASSAYRRLQPRIWMRLAAFVEGPHQVNPDQGAEWIEMEFVGGSIMDLDSRQMVNMLETREDPSAEQAGESHYLIGFVPEPGLTGIQFKVEDDLEGLPPTSFQGLRLEVLSPGLLPPQ